MAIANPPPSAVAMATRNGVKIGGGRCGITHGRLRRWAANFERIRDGMTLQEVENLLGGPPGNYSRIPDKEAGLWTIDPDRPDLNRQFFIGREVWSGDELAVAVWFDDQGRVVRKESHQTLDRGFVQRLRDFLGW